jgi:hypothetical protein
MYTSGWVLSRPEFKDVVAMDNRTLFLYVLASLDARQKHSGVVIKTAKVIHLP